MDPPPSLRRRAVSPLNRSSSLVAIGLVLLAVAVKAVFAARWGLLADEAYYALWGAQPALGYFDQPPLMGWVLAPLVGFRSELLLRLPGILATALATGAALTLHRDRVFGAAWWMGCVPLAWLTSFATPDALLLACWAITLAAAARGGRAWLLAGLCGALAAHAKYTGLAVFPLAWLAVRDRDRHALTAAVLWGLLLIPHGVWLLSHDAVSVRFQFSEGLWNRSSPGLFGPPQVILQQLALGNPLLFIAAIGAWRSPTLTREARIAWWTSAPLAVGFLVAALGGPPEAHWLAPAWIGVGVLLAAANGRLARLAWVGLGVGLFTSTVLIVHAEVGVVRLPLDPRDRLLEGPVLAQGVAAWALPEGVGMREAGVERAQRVLTERYQEAALITWYTGIPAARHPSCGRRDQFDLWEVDTTPPYLFVRPTTSGPLTCAGPARARHPIVGQTLQGRVVGRWDLFEVVP